MCAATWYRWENGTTYPGPQYLECLAQGLGMEADDLALRYSEAMALHYRDCVAGGNGSASDAAPASAGVAADAGVTGEASPEIRSVISATGEVWVKLNDLLERIFEAAVLKADRPRPQRRRPSMESVASRRKKRR